MDRQWHTFSQTLRSFLRPADLKKARAAYERKGIGLSELRKAEDAAIQTLVAKEKKAGLQAVTDGEFRRRYWHLDFLAALKGVQEVRADRWLADFKGAQPKAAP